jgi:hypothetical protein
MKEKDLIWVSKDLAKKFNELDTAEKQEAMVKEIIAKKRLELDRENESLEENMLLFKSVCLRHRNELAKVYEEESEKLEELFLSMGGIEAKVSKNVDEFVHKAKPISLEVSRLSEEVRRLNAAVSGINTHALENVIRLAKEFDNMGDKAKSLVRLMLDGE